MLATTTGCGLADAPASDASSNATLLAAFIAAGVSFAIFVTGFMREVMKDRRASKERRAAWKAYLTDLHSYMALNRESGVIWDMTKVNDRLDLALPLAYSAEGVAGLSPQQIYDVITSLLESKLAAFNVDLWNRDLIARAEAASSGEQKAQVYQDMRDAAMGFCDGAAAKLEHAIQSLGESAISAEPAKK